jgi:putative acetyltransferase
MTMMVRREGREHVDAITDVIRRAFATADGTDPPEPALVTALRGSEAWLPRLSLVAEISDRVVGHVLCTRGWLHPHRRPALALAPLAVDPAHQGRGVGAALMHAVVAAAEALDEPMVALLGDPAYYRRFGFRPGQELGVAAPDPGWGVHFQVRLLTARTAELEGTFHYPAAFDDL